MPSVSQASRRDVLKVSAAAVGGTVASGVLGSTAEAATSAASTPVMARASIATHDPVLHLARRATYGPTPSLLASMRKQGRTKWLEDQLNPGRIDDSYCNKLIAQRFPRLKWSISQAYNNSDVSWDLMSDLGKAHLARAVWSKRQLFELMVDFWSNHLNVTNFADNVGINRHDYDRNVIRKHALGRFDEMLQASALHPAMLYYLNNAESTKDNPNENYGRELLELHTVGVDAGYSENDMRNSVMIMTGFTVNWETGLFTYEPWIHYRGKVKVLGFHDDNKAENGKAMALRYLRYLAHHPQTAQHIARKLCLRFVSDDPPQSLVNALARTYLAHNTEIKPVLRKLFTSSVFAKSVGKKTRRPFEDLAATLRILSYRPDKTGTDGIQGLYWMCSDLGHAPLTWAMPNGYPDDAASWQSAGNTLERWNDHMSLAAHWWPSSLVQPPLRQLLPKQLPKTYGKFVDSLSQRLVFRTLADDHRKAVLTFLDKKATDQLTKDDAAVTWRLSQVVALILDSPYHGIR